MLTKVLSILVDAGRALRLWSMAGSVKLKIADAVARRVERERPGTCRQCESRLQNSKSNAKVELLCEMAGERSSRRTWRNRQPVPQLFSNLHRRCFCMERSGQVPSYCGERRLLFNLLLCRLAAGIRELRAMSRGPNTRCFHLTTPEQKRWLRQRGQAVFQ
jgi:hypothetical protein